MSRYIDADALAEKFHKMGLGEHSLIERLFADGVYAVIDTFPTADVEPVRHGYREKSLSMTGNWYKRCSKCKTRLSAVKQMYCPHCGAKMDGFEK